jgi:hypothetical protein
MRSSNISFLIPKSLLELVERRAQINGRTRNAEFRYLLDIGLTLAGPGDVVIQLDNNDWIRSIARISDECRYVLEDRKDLFKRGLGMELIRLVAFAIEESARKDLEIIKEMMARQGSPVLSG